MDFVSMDSEDIIGIADLDEQHSKFAKGVSELYELIGQDKPETMRYLVTQLVTEVKEHFITEEKYMTDNKYLSYFSHKQEHDRFYEKLLKIQESINAGTEKVNLEMLKSFRSWFKNHIKLNDKKLAIFLKESEII